MGRVENAPLWGGARCVMTTSRRSRYAVPHPEGRFPFFHRTRDTTATLADAICDRLLHNAHRLVLQGPSRRKEAKLED